MTTTRLAIASLLVSIVAMGVSADDKKEVIELKAETVSRAKFIDFAGELGVSLASLDELGSRIDAARLHANPIELTLSANLLSAAEAVSDKKASLTSAALVEEAVTLAELRANPAELKTIGKLVGGDIGDKLAKAAKAVSEKQVKDDEGTRDLHGTLIVDNRYNHDEVHVYVNGREIGHVRGHGVRYFHVHHAHYLDARDHYGHRWHRHIDYHVHQYVFRLNPPHHHH